LERTYDEIPRTDIKVLIGGFNAEVGIRNRHEISNVNGQKVVDSSLEKNMCISTTYFSQKSIRKETWISPAGEI
jgi:hypothetical protein